MRFTEVDLEDREWTDYDEKVKHISGSAAVLLNAC
jgi:hypothetical protein